MDCEYYTDLTPWYNSIEKMYKGSKREEKPIVSEAAPAEGEAAAVGDPAATADAAATNSAPVDAAAAADPAAIATDPAAMPTDPAAMPPTDPMATADAGAVDPLTGQPIAGGSGADLTKGGWVIQMIGYHLHNSLTDPPVDVGDEGETFILNTFVKKLEEGTVELPDADGKMKEVKIADLGIRYPVIVTSRRTQSVEYLAESAEVVAQKAAALNQPNVEGIQRPGLQSAQPPKPKTFKLRQYDFYIQFCWQPQPRTQREEKLVQQPGADPSTAAVEDVTAPSGT
jgi:hypothetical protein